MSRLQPLPLFWTLLFLVAAHNSTLSQESETRDRLLVRFSTGLYDIRRTGTTNLRQIEIALPSVETPLQPFTGFMATQKRDTYCYIGLLANVVRLEHFRILLRFASGLYTHGNGVNLGFPLEFLSELEFGWQLNRHSQIGISISHLSNAAFADLNPGLEIVAVSYSITR